jgi:hypothetical protein
MDCASSTVKWHAQQGIPAYSNQRSTWGRGLRTGRSTLAVHQSTKPPNALNAKSLRRASTREPCRSPPPIRYQNRDGAFGFEDREVNPIGAFVSVLS